MDWERKLAKELMSRGQSGYLSVIEDPIALGCHINGCSVGEIADRIVEFRRVGFKKTAG